MATEAPKTIGEAIEDVTEDDLNAPEEDDDEAGETADDDANDGDDVDDGEDDSDDESDDDDESDESDDEDDDSDDDEDADWGVAAEDDTDFFDDLSQEQLAEIKKNPELNALRKQLMKGYEKKTIKHANLVKLGEAYGKNPLGVLQAIADQLGLKVVQRGDAPAATGEAKAAEEKKASKVEAAAEKLEKLFGEKAGPAVREALNEFVAAVSEENLAPVQERLSKDDSEREKARFLREEADFRERHAKVLTPEIEEEVVKLGESGRYVPGPKQTASDFLDMLLEISLAKRGKSIAKKAGREAGKKLRAKVERNRRDREPRGRNSKSGVKKVSRLEKEPESFKSLSEAIDAAASEMEDDFEE